MLPGLDTRYLRLCLPLNRPHAALVCRTLSVQDRLLFFFLLLLTHLEGKVQKMLAGRTALYTYMTYMMK